MGRHGYRFMEAGGIKELLRVRGCEPVRGWVGEKVGGERGECRRKGGFGRGEGRGSVVVKSKARMRMS